MKVRLSLILLGMLFFGQVTTLWAAPVSTVFMMSAQMPLAASVGITVSSVNSATNLFTVVTGTNISFGQLTYNPTSQIWLSDHYFALDFAPVNGVGNVNAVFAYTEVSNPNGSGHGLGYKTTATFVDEIAGANGTTETLLQGHGKKILSGINDQVTGSAELLGGSLRIYLSIATKDPTQKYPDPSNSEPFTNADAGGNYLGTLTITTTIA